LLASANVDHDTEKLHFAIASGDHTDTVLSQRDPSVGCHHSVFKLFAAARRKQPVRNRILHHAVIGVKC